MGKLPVSNTVFVFDSVYDNEIEILRSMLNSAYKFDLNFVDPDMDLTALMLAIVRRDNVMTNVLLEDERIKINTQNSEGCTALMFACRYGDKYIVSKLLDMGATIETTDFQYFCNPAHIAVLAGNLEVIEVLKQSAINWDVVDFQGDTPLHLAVLNDKPEILISLLQLNNINIHKKNKEGLTAYESAMERGNWQAINEFNEYIIRMNNKVSKEKNK